MKEKRSKKKFIVGIISLAIFVFIFLEIAFNGFLVGFDKDVNYSILRIQSDFLVRFSEIMGFVFDPAMIILIVIVISVIFLFGKYKKYSAFLFLTMILGELLLFSIKNFVRRARPENSLIKDNVFAFPSGHAFSIVLFLGLLNYLFMKEKSKNARFFIFLTILVVVIVSFSRILLNAHWFSDVLGGILLAVFALTLSIIARENK